MNRLQNSALLTSLMLTFSACSGSSSMFVQDSDEVVNAIGDLTSSVDEMLMVNQPAPTTLRVFHSGMGGEETELTGPERLSCLVTTPLNNSTLSCASGIKTWTLDGQCSSGLRTGISGAVTFTYSDSSCAFSTPSQTLTRKPSLLMTGKKIGALTTTSSSQGQVLTYTGSDTYEFQVNDLHRVFSWEGDSAGYPLSVSTPEKWVVTGASRSGRTISSGSIQAIHGTFGWTARLSIVTPLVQTDTCNCPTSGKLTGAITGDQEDSQFEIEFISCGVAKMSEHGMHSMNVKFDRCAPI